MFNIFKWWQNYQLEKLKLKLDATNKPYEALTSIVERLTASNNENTKVLQEWMAGFRVTELPKSSIVRDSDEFQAEREREMGVGSEINTTVRKSIENALKADAFPELMDLL